MSNESAEGPEVPQARQPLISDPHIFTDFAEFEAKLKEKYGEKATADVIKFFAQEEKPRYERIEYEFDPVWKSRALGLSGLVLTIIYTLLRTQGIVLWPLLWLAVSTILPATWFFGVSAYYYGDTTDDTVNNYFLNSSGFRQSFIILFVVNQVIRFFFVNDTDEPIYELQMSSFFS